ncbi:hypothetical protein A35E_00594 [secondary endosymbiont of Heteropsylla cubana]|uniref:Ribosome maturation factor RimP n=1 Tax=secondary endosymbiont of Heteropsylla cubana TaxID=134287 RepID=J7GT11_9ENTR|nr:ribosome maturation factor RimP [secondary endosymbiont of Heteropsylla cubana]AFP85877.1 hypothetical protein A35E_00594 [secondary endosymbiont of Heteropsylla cubana]
MSTLEQKLIQIISVPVEDLGFELVGVDFIRNHQSTLRVYIDNDRGITANNCADVSQKISILLDAADPISTPYTLEISSPGLNRPLFTTDHYRRFIGSNIKLILRVAVKNRLKWKGILTAVNADIITLTVGKKNQVFALHDIQKANLIFNF